MAHTKQTARASTGGRAIQKSLRPQTPRSLRRPIPLPLPQAVDRNADDYSLPSRLEEDFRRVSILY